MTPDGDIADFAAAALLRYFRAGAALSAAKPALEAQRDREILRVHWAMSQPVRDLLVYVISHQHELHALLSHERQIDAGLVRGRIHAAATLVERHRTGNPTLFVVDRPVRTFDTGPNQVLAWALTRIALFAAPVAGWARSGSNYGEFATGVSDLIAQVRRLEPVRDLSAGSPRPPSPGSLRNAARSRQRPYRLAVEALRLLEGLENLREDAVRDVLSSTLVGPYEVWRRYELAVALALGEALAQATGAPATLSALGPDPAAPVVQCERFDIYWQQTTTAYLPPALEPSEAKVRDILAAYGMGPGHDRPDLVVIDRETMGVAAIVEVKYLAGDTAAARFREAVGQIVRYSRGYATDQAYDDLVERSLVVLSHGAPPPPPVDAAAPMAADFDTLRTGGLYAWASRLL